MDPPPHVKFLLALRFVFLAQQQRLNCVSMRTASAAAQTPVDCSELHQQPKMLFFVQPLFIDSVINCRALQPLHSCRLLIKICLLLY